MADCCHRIEGCSNTSARYIYIYVLGQQSERSYTLLAPCKDTFMRETCKRSIYFNIGVKRNCMHFETSEVTI